MQSTQLTFLFQRDDITKNLPLNMQFVDLDASNSVTQSNSKFTLFQNWLLDNGANFNAV